MCGLKSSRGINRGPEDTQKLKNLKSVKQPLISKTTNFLIDFNSIRKKKREVRQTEIAVEWEMNGCRPLLLQVTEKLLPAVVMKVRTH